MDKHRTAYRRIVDNAQKAFDSTQAEVVYDATPVRHKKINYISAFIWTSVVAAIICSIFLGFLLFLINESNIEENLTQAATSAVTSLEQMVQRQNEEIKTLREENKKIHNYLQLWTPMDAQRRAAERCKIFEEKDDAWSKGPNILFRDYKTPQHMPRYTNICQEGNLCSYFSE
jgi:ElaB/YqjD/DUF883 family membrane-anchored ribosome-binding protein